MDVSKQLGVTFAEFDKETEEQGTEWHTLRDWGMFWLEPYKIDLPEPDERLIEIPGAYIPIDVTETILGHPGYKKRSVELNFHVKDNDYFTYEQIKSMVAEHIHGKRLRLYLDTDPDYFYLARWKIDFDKSQKADSKLVIKGDADPYKYNRMSSLDDWLWDPFDFEYGVIGQSKDIYINGEHTEILLATQIPANPKFITDAAMRVEYEGVTYDLPEGESQIPYIILRNHENILIFKGKGTVSIDYRGGIL